jgi:amidase
LPDLFTATIDDVQDGLSCGTFTSVQLTMAYLARIAEVNPILHAVIETNPDALTIAASLDEQRKAGNVIGPLHGVPIIIKDNIATFDKMNTTAGSFSLLGAKVTQDSTMAAKLREAGVIILGKANLSQWANYRSSNSTNGWTSRGGQTTGAYYPMQDPSGSSSGSAVSSSIGLAMAALGSETSGSIISPSSRNSLAGVKPTVGLTSRFLVIPISSTQDTVGVSYLLALQSSKLMILTSR